MRDFPSCLGENGVQVSDASCSSVGGKKGSHNSVTCIYRCKLLGKSCLISMVWSKVMMGQCLSVEINDASLRSIYKVDVKSSLFSKRKGSKCFEVNSCKLEVFWDLSWAKFDYGPEPVEGYYVAVVLNGEMVLKKEAFKKTGAVFAFCKAVFVSKREHISGKRIFGTKAQFSTNGRIHDLKIEYAVNCGEDSCLLLYIDAKTVMQVQHLPWKFRGNDTILVDELPVEVYWDVHNWLFGAGVGNAVFMFETSLSAEKLWSSPSTADSFSFPWRCSESFKESKLPGLGFCLFLYAWKTE